MIPDHIRFAALISETEKAGGFPCKIWSALLDKFQLDSAALDRVICRAHRIWREAKEAGYTIEDIGKLKGKKQ